MTIWISLPEKNSHGTVARGFFPRKKCLIFKTWKFKHFMNKLFVGKWDEIFFLKNSIFPAGNLRNPVCKWAKNVKLCSVCVTSWQSFFLSSWRPSGTKLVDLKITGRSIKTLGYKSAFTVCWWTTLLKLFRSDSLTW